MVKALRLGLPGYHSRQQQRRRQQRYEDGDQSEHHQKVEQRERQASIVSHIDSFERFNILFAIRTALQTRLIGARSVTISRVLSSKTITTHQRFAVETIAPET